MKNEKVTAPAPALTEGEKIVASIKEQLGNLQDRRDQLEGELANINAQLADLRDALGGDDEPARPARRRTNTERAHRQSNTKNLYDATLDALRKLGDKGGTRTQVAELVIKGGYNTDSDLESFANSVYVSGLFKLIKDEMCQSHRGISGGREAIYKITKKGAKVKE